MSKKSGEAPGFEGMYGHEGAGGKGGGEALQVGCRGVAGGVDRRPYDAIALQPVKDPLRGVLLQVAVPHRVGEAGAVQHRSDAPIPHRQRAEQHDCPFGQVRQGLGEDAVPSVPVEVREQPFVLDEHPLAVRDILRPRKTLRNVRDANLKGYGVRIMPSGTKRYFIHSQHRGHRVWKIVGDAAVMTEAEARARARSMLAALRDDRDIETEASGDALFETVAEEVFVRYGRRWKPRTLAVNRRYLRSQILPFFAGRPVAEITREEVQRWFRSLHATPAAANRSAPILSVIMQQAEAWGLRPETGNPSKGIKRYRQKRSERFLSPEEYRRLGMVLERHEARQPFRVAALRLLLLTGCRKSEIVTLEWRFYRDGRLYLGDSKMGPFFASGLVRALRGHTVPNGLY